MAGLYSQYSDTYLAELVRQKNPSAFAEIYERYWAVLFRYALRMLKSQEDAGDVVQDVFTQLWVKATEIDPTMNVNGWLYTSMRNLVISKINRDKRHADYMTSLGSYLEKGEYVTDDQLREKEFAAIIAREVDKLPTRMREIFLLSREGNLSHKAIAGELGISPETVKKQVANALKILRSRLSIAFFLMLIKGLLLFNLFF